MKALHWLHLGIRSALFYITSTSFYNAQMGDITKDSGTLNWVCKSMLFGNKEDDGVKPIGLLWASS